MTRTANEHSYFDGLNRDQQERLSEVLDEYIVGLEQGQAPSREELIARYPDLAKPLIAYLDSLDFLQDAALGFAPSFESTAIARDADASPQQLGDYEIECEIGRGGMGIVYKARQRSLDRPVALKVLPFAALLDAKQIARFRNEAQAAAQLQHPHIVPVYAVGNERGVHYFAMRLIDGQPLSSVVEQARLTARDRSGHDTATVGSCPATVHATLAADYSSNASAYCRRVATLGIQAAHALHSAHELGIVHRDVKPSNLMLDADGKLWVTDFGLARFQADANLTRTGDFVGTVRYMSPEQSQGKSQIVDHRTDVYSLGATLYELLTLHHALRGDDVTAMLRQLDRGEPYTLRQWNDKIPRDLESIVHKAISKCRDERYDTAQDMANDLQRFLDRKPIVAKRATVAQRLAKWSARHQRIVLAVTATLLVAVLSLGVSVGLIAHAMRQQHVAWQHAQQHQLDYRVQLAESKRRLALILHQNGNVAEALATCRESEATLSTLLLEAPRHPDAVREHARTLSDLAFMLARSDPQQAEQYFAEAARIQREVVAQDDARLPEVRRELAVTLANWGSLQRTRSQWATAVESFSEAVQLYEDARRKAPASPATTRSAALAHNGLGLSYDAVGDSANASVAFTASIALLESLIEAESPATDHSTLGGVYNNLAMVMERDQRLVDAANQYATAIQHQSQALRDSPNNIVFRQFLDTHLMNRGRVLRQMGHLADATRQTRARQRLWANDAVGTAAVAEELAMITQLAQRSGQTALAAEVERDAFAALDATVRLGSHRDTVLRDCQTLSALVAQRGQSNTVIAGTQP